jgi:alpha-tubulin suppressor-like RCC1 family protein
VGDTRNRLEPTPVAGAIAFTAISAGSVHSCGLTAEGQAHCWGSARFGQMGTGGVFPAHALDQPVTSPTPVFQQPPGHIVFTTIDAGRDFTCGTDLRFFKAHCWGLGLDGQVGNNQLGIHVFPREVSATLDMRFNSVTAGWGTHACAVTSARGAYCWGTSPFGAIGPFTTFSGQPIRIPGPF